MDFQLDLGYAIQSPAVPREIRELDAGDLLLLQAAPQGLPVPSVQKISQRHRMLARMLAQGLSPGECAIACNYTPARVAQLQRDPSFRELVAFYQGRVDDVIVDRFTALSDLSIDAMEELRARLESAPEEFSNSQLMKLVEVSADRTGMGPSSTQLNINADLATRLAAARKRLAQETKNE